MDEFTAVSVDAILAITPKALFIDFGITEYWCPRSLIEDGESLQIKQSDIDFGDTSMDLNIKTWWLEREDLI